MGCTQSVQTFNSINSRFTALEGSESAINTIKSLCRLGASHALDNFGTHYYGMHQLTLLPLNTIKIDPSFIQNLGIQKTDEQIVSSIIMLSKKMGLSVIAKGVETEQQLKKLIEEKCDYA